MSALDIAVFITLLASLMLNCALVVRALGHKEDLDHAMGLVEFYRGQTQAKEDR